MPILLESFAGNVSGSRDNPHGHANQDLMRELATALAIQRPEGAWWKAVPPPALRAAALRLLAEDSARRSGNGGAG